MLPISQSSYSSLVLLALGVITPAVQAACRSEYIDHALNATDVLNQLWYNQSSGQWGNQWWNSANALTALGNLVTVDDTFSDTADQYFKTILVQAQASNNGSFLNDFYDDEGWWALAWIRVYDVTRNKTYLNTAKAIWQDMTTAVDATCGGVWWSKDKQNNNAISNELFAYVSAALANRAPNDGSDYRVYAVNQANWFLNSPLINSNHTVTDGLDLATCAANGSVYTYNSGAILGAMVEMHTLTGQSNYLDTANKIAQGAMETLVDADGVLTELGSPDALDMTRAQFKGVFVRNLAYLQAASPNDQYVEFLQRNADSIFKSGRLGDGQIGPNWAGPYANASMATQSSAIDCFVAAASVTLS